MTLQAQSTDNEEVDLTSLAQEAADAAAAPEENKDDAPLTTAEIKQLLANHDAHIQKTLRAAQSIVDKAEGRIGKSLAALQNTRKAEIAKAIGITPEQLASFDKALGEDVLIQPARGAALPGASLAPQPRDDDAEAEDETDTNDVNAQAALLYQQGGLAVGDPELAYVVNDGTVEEFYGSIRAAAKAKAARLKATPGSPARVPGLGPTGSRAQPDLSKLSTRQLMEMAEKQRSR